MITDLHQEIILLQGQIKNEEAKIIDAFSRNDYDAVTKSSARINSNLKHLSILVNNAPIDQKDNKELVEYLRNHYENLWKLTLPA